MVGPARAFGMEVIAWSQNLIVDRDALVEALREGRITAGLDVYDHEPLPREPIRRLG